MPVSAAPWRLAARRLRRDRRALAAAGVLMALVLISVAAPVWANHVAHTGPEEIHITDKVEVDGKRVAVVAEDGQPIGPTWEGRFFLGADSKGRDVMVRLLYGGRNSLLIGMAAALATIALGIGLGLLSGYAGGLVDGAISAGVDVLWAFPGILLGISVGAALTAGGLDLGPVEIASGSLLIPVLVITIGAVPYVVRPIRAEVRSVREQEFVLAARAVGMRPRQIMAREILPNVSSTLLVLFPVIVGNAIQLEAALSFLGVGVQPPDPSWGNLIDEGSERLTTAPHLAVAAGMLVVLTVLTLNMLGDGVRRGFDPHARRRSYLKQT
ncbi:MAG TPA: ABC transporter permease [Thermoleophilaceae bacterium]|nr:ABC transporter permease [Thermoleophilaceae bacterium]